MASHYTIRQTTSADFGFASPMWQDLPQLAIDHFHARSSDHHPHTTARLAHGKRSLYVRFDVEDCYVRSVATNYQDSVCLDSCVELFIQPKAESGYFNIEINGGGTMLLYYVEDSTMTPQGLAKATPVLPELGASVAILHTLPRQVEPEITTPTHWSIAYRFPFAVFEHYVGTIGPASGQTWRGNLYKCADHTSHPHWATWSPIGEKLNFHQPQYFGQLCFE